MWSDQGEMTTCEAKRVGDCGKELKRRRLFGECHLLDADTRLDRARKDRPRNQGSGGRCNDPAVSSSIHNISTSIHAMASKTATARPPNERLRLVSQP
jgi:hypothetical protein